MRNNFGLGYSLRRNDWSSLIPRSARDLPKAVMTFPTGRDRLLDNRHIQRTGLKELYQATYKWSYCQGKSDEIVYQSGSGMPFSWCAGRLMVDSVDFSPTSRIFEVRAHEHVQMERICPPPVTAHPPSVTRFSRTHRAHRPWSSSHRAPASIVPDEGPEGWSKLVHVGPTMGDTLPFCWIPHNQGQIGPGVKLPTNSS